MALVQVTSLVVLLPEQVVLQLLLRQQRAVAVVVEQVVPFPLAALGVKESFATIRGS